MIFSHHHPMPRQTSPTVLVRAVPNFQDSKKNLIKEDLVKKTYNVLMHFIRGLQNRAVPFLENIRLNKTQWIVIFKLIFADLYDFQKRQHIHTALFMHHTFRRLISCSILRAVS